jgi:Protein of unknown function (DUF1588)/Protein of unknown function (DUF1592)/Protein of unknown function (DUF1595)/Protein of unknown function (DUF1587)
MCSFKCAGLLLFVGCTGVVSGSTSGTPQNPGPLPLPGVVDQPNATRPDSGIGTEVAADPPAPSASLVALTASQTRNTIEDVFGLDVAALAELPANFRSQGFYEVSSRSISLSSTDIKALRSSCRAMAQKAVQKGGPWLSCQPANSSDEACTKEVVTALATRLYRRTLDASDIDPLLALAAQARIAPGNFSRGLEFAISAMLLSPQFVFRNENASSAQLNPQQLAERLAFLLWDSGPDSLLMQAAASQTLETPAGYDAQVERLLGDARFSRGVKAFVSDLLFLERGELAQKDAATFPQWSPALMQQLRLGTEKRLLEHLVVKQRPWAELFTASEVWVNATTAPVYGLQNTSAAFVKSSLPTGSRRVGFLTEPGILAGLAHPLRTSPTLRGKFVQERFLCNSVLPAPAGVNTTLPVTANGATRRMQLEDHMRNPSCSACHKAMDPIGFAFENFDALGQERQLDNSVVIDSTGSLGGVGFVDAKTLAQVIQSHPAQVPCLAQNLWQHALGSEPSPLQSNLVKSLVAEFGAAGGTAAALFRAVVKREEFKLVGPSD